LVPICNACLDIEQAIELCVLLVLLLLLSVLLVSWFLVQCIFKQQSERTFHDVSEIDTTAELARQGDSLDSWPSVIHGSTSVILQVNA